DAAIKSNSNLSLTAAATAALDPLALYYQWQSFPRINQLSLATGQSVANKVHLVDIVDTSRPVNGQISGQIEAYYTEQTLRQLTAAAADTKPMVSIGQDHNLEPEHLPP